MKTLKIFILLFIMSFSLHSNELMENVRKDGNFLYLYRNQAAIPGNEALNFANDMTKRMLDLRILLPIEDGSMYRMTTGFGPFEEVIQAGKIAEMDTSSYYSLHDEMMLIIDFITSSHIVADKETTDKELKNINNTFQLFDSGNGFTKLNDINVLMPYALLKALKAHIIIKFLATEGSEYHDNMTKSYREELEKISKELKSGKINNFDFKTPMRSDDKQYGFDMYRYVAMVIELSDIIIQEYDLHPNNSYDPIDMTRRRCAFWIFDPKYTNEKYYELYLSKDNIYEEEFVEPGTDLFEKYYERFRKAVNYDEYFKYLQENSEYDFGY